MNEEVPTAPAPASARRTRAVKLGLVALVVGGLLAAHQLGLLELFGEPQRLKEALLELGPLGYVAYVAAFSFLQPFGVPGTAFIIAAPLIWPWPVAFALSLSGSLGASVVGFSFARFLARAWVAARIPPRFRAYDDALARRSFVTVFTLRFLFWMHPMLHAFFGVSRVGFWTHLWGSLAGYVLPLLAVAWFGQKLFNAVRGAEPSTWIGIAVAAGVVVAIVLLIRRKMQRPGRPRSG